MAGTIVAPDGITWMEYAAPSLVNAWAIAHSLTLDLFTAVSYNGYARVLTSSNGVNWTLVVKGDAPGRVAVVLTTNVPNKYLNYDQSKYLQEYPILKVA
jgi:hypothetical protein